MSGAISYPNHHKPAHITRIKAHGIHEVKGHKIHHGDCLATLDKIPSKSVDVIVTSPPYNINLSYNSYNDNKTELEYLEWMDHLFKRLKRVLKDDGSFFLNISGSSRQPWLPFLITARLKEHFELQNHIVWVKSIAVDRETSGHFKPISGARFTHHNHEHIFHLTKKGDVKLDRLSIGVPFADKSNINRFGHKADLRCRGNTWFIPYRTVNSKAKKFSHPGTFPVELPLWCIFLHGKRNPVVLDPFVGTGSTLVAADFSGGKGIGIEVDDTYVKTAVQRLKASIMASKKIILTQDEMKLLLQQDPSTRQDGGFQSLLVSLQERLNKTTGELTLENSDLERIPKYAFDYHQGGWEDRLKDIFGRNLGPKLGRTN
ncbi:site-specific DNA-methyltransferase [Acetobacter sp. A11-2]|uniref:DNA-methyltransferase n=1 Tax=Acetobacter sp. A11-2 TaxID=3157859 RepID=UPI0032EBA1AC